MSPPLFKLFRNDQVRGVLSLAGESAILLFCRIGGAVLVMLTQILLARWMGPEQLGIYVYAFAWCVFLSLILGLGLPSAAVRFMGQGIAEHRGGLVLGYYRQATLLGMGISLLLVFAYFIGHEQLQLAQDTLVTHLVVLSVPVFTAININVATALAMSWFRTAFLINVIFRPAFFLAIIIVIWLISQRLTAHVAMSMQAVAALVTAGLLLVIVITRLRRKFGDCKPEYDTRLWLRTAPPLLIITLFLEYFQDLNIIFVGPFLSAHELAIYNASIRISFLIAFGSQAISTIILPRTALYFAKSDHAALQSVATHAARLQLIWAVCATAGLVIVGKPILALFGESFINGFWAMLVLAFAQVVVAAFGPVTQLLSNTGHQDQCLYVYVTAVATLLALTYLLAPIYGAIGAAAAVLLTFLLQSVWMHHIVVRRLGVYPSIFPPKRERSIT